MTENRPSNKRSGLPLGLIGMLVLVAATERYIARRDIDLGTMLTIEWRRTGKAATREATRAELLCFGTSLSHVGIAPSILKERTGLTTQNLALTGGQPYASYTMLRHALDAGAKPKAIVVDFKWAAVSMDPRGGERIFPEIASFAECLALGRTVGDLDFLTRMALVSCLPSYRCRTEVRANIAAALQGVEPERNVSWLTMVHNIKVNHGAQLAPRRDFEVVFGPGTEAVFEADWKPHPVADAYIDRFFALAASRGIPIVWLIPPVTPEAQARLDQLGAAGRYTAYVQATIARHPGVSVVDGRWSNYAKNVFYDSTHLNRYGAANLSEDLADAIVVRLRDPGRTSGLWVKLPGYRGDFSGAKLEDFLDSHAAVAAMYKDKGKARR